MDRKDAQILVFGLLALWFIMFFAMMLVSYYKYMPGVVNEKTTTNGGLKNENTDYERKYQQIDCH